MGTSRAQGIEMPRWGVAASGSGLPGLGRRLESVAQFLQSTHLTAEQRSVHGGIELDALPQGPEQAEELGVGIGLLASGVGLRGLRPWPLASIKLRRRRRRSHRLAWPRRRRGWRHGWRWSGLLFQRIHLRGVKARAVLSHQHAVLGQQHLADLGTDLYHQPATGEVARRANLEQQKLALKHPFAELVQLRILDDELAD